MTEKPCPPFPPLPTVTPQNDINFDDEEWSVTCAGDEREGGRERGDPESRYYYSYLSFPPPSPLPVVPPSFFFCAEAASHHSSRIISSAFKYALISAGEWPFSLKRKRWKGRGGRGWRKPPFSLLYNYTPPLPSLPPPPSTFKKTISRGRGGIFHSPGGFFFGGGWRRGSVEGRKSCPPLPPNTD